MASLFTTLLTYVFYMLVRKDGAILHYLEKICKGSDEFSEMMSNTPLILYRLMQG